MKKLKKLYWKARNMVQAQYLRALGGSGLLSERKDPRDFEAKLGLSLGKYKPKYYPVSYFRYQFLQKDNICTAAATVLAISEQLGVRFSVKATMRMMVRLGMVNGNGFSYSRAPLEVITKHGLIPYHLMPDENVHMRWSEYSKWDAETEKLYRTVAPVYKMDRYEKISSTNELLKALDMGFVPTTASGWCSAMNNPKAPNFLLKFLGAKIGAHQYRVTGNKTFLETPQTFGEYYGDHGKAYSETVFGRQYYTTYILKGENGGPMMDPKLLMPFFLRENEGKMVKAHDHLNDSRCYVIEQGKKRHVSGEDDMRTFQELFRKTGLTRVNKTLLEAVPLGERYPFIQ